MASRCTRGLHGEPCGGLPFDVEVAGRRNCPICTRLLHDRALELAVYALDPTLPDLPAGTLWTPMLPAHALPQAPAPPPAPVPKVRAYLRIEQGQVRQGTSLPTGVPIYAGRVASLPPPPPPPGAGGVMGLRGVRSSVPIPPVGGRHAPACSVVESSPPPPPAA